MFFLAGFRLLPPRSVSFQPPRRRRGRMGNREGTREPWPLLVSVGRENWGEPRGYIPAASVTHSVDRCRIVYLISTAINQESRSHPEAAERCVRPINERL